MGFFQEICRKCGPGDYLGNIYRQMTCSLCTGSQGQPMAFSLCEKQTRKGVSKMLTGGW